MQQLRFDKVPYEAADFLDGYEIFKRKSSNVNFFGFKETTMFVQFNSGACYLYELTYTAVSMALAADSIGKYVANQVVKKFPSQKVEDNLIITAKRDTALLKEEIRTPGNILLGTKNEEVYIVSDNDPLDTIVETIHSGKRYKVRRSQLLFKKAS